MYTELILDKLGYFYDDVAKKKHGNCPEITYGYLIEAILNAKGKIAAHASFPELGIQTFNRMMHRIFPNVKLNGGQQTWFFYLLSIINHKNCGKCDSIKSLAEFSENKSNSSLGKCSICKECRAKDQVGQYSKYLESHTKSNIKHKAVKAERNNRYKFTRSLRVTNWSQTKEIENFYFFCPEGYHVDHELPLKGELVSGLHVLENLQYLPEKDNLSKGNKINLEEYNTKYYS